MKPEALSLALPVLLASLLPVSPLHAAPGDPDLSFGVNGMVAGNFTAIALQNDGKILAVSGSQIRRYLPNGTLDTTFGGGTGTVTSPFQVSTHERALALLPDGGIAVTGSREEDSGNLTRDVTVMCLNADGTPNTALGPGGVWSYNVGEYSNYQLPPQTYHTYDVGVGVIVLPSGGFVVLGISSQPASLAMVSGLTASVFSSSGALVSAPKIESLDPGGNFALLPDGRIYISVPYAPIRGGVYDPANGSVATLSGISLGGSADRPAQPEYFGLAVKPDGTVLQGAYNSTGKLLESLSISGNSLTLTGPGLIKSQYYTSSIAVQADQRIVAGETYRVARYLPDGTPDYSFQTLDNGGSGLVRTVAIQKDGKILAAGQGITRLEDKAASGTLVLEQPEGTPAPAALDFGAVSVGGKETRTFTVRNPGTLPLYVFNQNLTGTTVSDLTTDLTFPLAVPAGGTTTFTLRWAPTVRGPLSASLRLVSSDTARRGITISLTGFALAAGPELDVQADHAIALTSGQAGGIRLSHFRPRIDLTLTNNGDQPLHLGTAQLTGSASAFSLAAPLPSLLAPATSHTTTLRYTPGEQTVSATLSIPGDDPDENPFTIPVTGDPSTSSATWQASWFAGLTGGETSDTGDADGDGITNLMEYATFSSPLQATGPAGTLVKKGALLEYTITRPLEASAELLYELQWTDTIATGTWKTNGTSATVVSDDGIRQTVKFTVPAGTGSRYVRLKVTRVL